MEETRVFIDWLKNPKPVDKTPYRCPNCAAKMEKPVMCDKCKKKKDDETEAKRKRDSDDLGFLMAAVAGAI